MDHMKNFEQLQGHVEDGSMQIISVEAIPRSVSTALARALNEAERPSVYVNEPFNRMKYDINDAAGHILAAAEEHLTSSDEPLTVVTKNMARNLSLPILEQWIPLCRGTVWSIRDPRVQIASLVTRIANDLAYEPGADVLQQEDLTPEHLQAASDFLEKGPKSTDFSKTSWADIGNHFRNGYHPDRSIVVDGGELTSNPRLVLANACATLGIAFRSGMIEGWEGDFINANTGYSTTLDDKNHAWTREAASSTGLTSLSRMAIDLSILPRPLQNHLTEVAIPTYEEMMAANNA
jgi:hypothetical protein